MKKLITKSIVFFLSIFALSLFLPTMSYAQENPILFWGTTCPYCLVVKEQIEEKGLDKQIEIDELEIYNNDANARIFREKIAICNIPSNQAGVPLLFMDSNCWVGPDPIIQALEAKIAGVDLNENDSEQPVVSDGETQEEESSQRSTALMIVLIPAFLLILIVIGHALKKDKSAKSILLLPLLLPLIFQSLSTPTHAVCPVCTVAVGAGLGISRYLGIDDLISSVWIGGLVMSVAVSFGLFLDKKTKLSKTVSQIISIALFYTLLFGTLHLLNITGDTLNQIWGIDKIVLGSVIGAVVFKIGALIHFKLLDSNEGKSKIPFQKVVIPVGFLWLASVILYFVIF